MAMRSPIRAGWVLLAALSAAVCAACAPAVDSQVEKLNKPDFSYSPTGSLDTAFGGGLGYASDAGLGSAEGLAVAVDSQGRIVVAGDTDAGADVQAAVWRLNSDGTLDTSFATGGLYTYGPNAGQSDEFRDVVIDSAGRILVTGKTGVAPSNSLMTVIRLLDDGSPDPSFLGTGVFTHTVGSSQDEGQSLVLDSSGRIVVTGMALVGGAEMMTIWRLLDSGSLDFSFDGGAGYAVNNPVPGNASEGNGIAIDSAGRYVVTGDEFDASSNYFRTVWRVLDTGVLDATFNGSGFSILNSPTGGSLNRQIGIGIDSSGRILSSGFVTSLSGDLDLAAVRLLGDGSLDTGFGGTGDLEIDDSVAPHQANGAARMALDSRGRAVMGGIESSLTDFDVGIWRVNTDGSLDGTWGNGGVLVETFASGSGRDDFANDVKIDSSGFIVATGVANSGTDMMAVWRFK